MMALLSVLFSIFVGAGHAVFIGENDDYYAAYGRDDQANTMKRLDSAEAVVAWVETHIKNDKIPYMGRVVNADSPRLSGHNKQVFSVTEDGILTLVDRVIKQRDTKKAGISFADTLGYDKPPTSPQRLIIFKSQVPEVFQITWANIAAWLERGNNGDLVKGSGKTVADTYKQHAEGFAPASATASQQVQLEATKALNKRMNDACKDFLETEECKILPEYKTYKAMNPDEYPCTSAWHRAMGREYNKTLAWLQGTNELGQCKASGQEWELRLLMSASAFNPLWAGNGFTKSSTDVRGVREFLEPDQDISRLDGIEYTFEFKP